MTGEGPPLRRTVVRAGGLVTKAGLRRQSGRPAGGREAVAVASGVAKGIPASVCVLGGAVSA